MDASQEVSQAVYSKEKEFVKRLANHFNINTSGPRGSAVVYAENTYTVARFGDLNFEQRIDNAARLKERPRRMDRALETAAQILRSSGRDGHKIVILLTTGKQSTGGKTLRDAVKPLQKIGAQTFVVAIGNKPNLRELYSVVGKPEDIYPVPRAENLLQQSRLISKMIKNTPGRNIKFLFLIFLF